MNNKENVLEFMGNVLLGIVCPFLFLISDNPHKDLFNNGKDSKDGNCK